MNIVYEALLCICSDELFYRLWYIYLLEQKLFLNAEIEFINKDGWLVKRYLANQEITNIVVSNSIAGIIYRDQIEIVNL